MPLLVEQLNIGKLLFHLGLHNILVVGLSEFTVLSFELVEIPKRIILLNLPLLLGHVYDQNTLI